MEYQMKSNRSVLATWKTRDGRKIKIRDMSDDHLRNTLVMLQRVAERKRIASVGFYVTCPVPTGDAAEDCFDHEFDSVMESTWEDYVPEIYWKMLDEEMKRNLTIPDVERNIEVELHYVMKLKGIKNGKRKSTRR